MESNTKGSATFYQYKLIKKINLTPLKLRIYLALLPVLLIAETVLLSWWSILYMLVAAPVILWIQFVISRSVLVISGHPLAKRWSLSLTLPWLGYIPDQYISYAIFRKVQLHNLWIGLSISALFIVWSPPAFTASLMICHLWLLLPRLFALFHLRKETKEGMIKLNPADISYYTQ